MRNAKLAGIGAVVVALAAAGLLLQPAEAQKKKKTKVRVADAHYLMEGIVASNCGALKKALAAEDWKKIAFHNAMLNEGGHVLMADGRCPDAEWAKGAKTLQECSKVLAGKVKDKDLEGARSAFKALTKGCGTCHKKHKK